MIWIYIIGALVVLIGMGAFFGAPYVPSRRRDLRQMLDELYPLSRDDVLLDIGSGDGLVLREARRRGATAIGYEINPVFVFISRLLSFGDSDTTIRWVNAWTTPFPDDVTLLYIFSVSKDGRRLSRKVQREADRLERPLTLICYGSPLPDIHPAAVFEAYALYTFQPLHLR